MTNDEIKPQSFFFYLHTVSKLHMKQLSIFKRSLIPLERATITASSGASYDGC